MLVVFIAPPLFLAPLLAAAIRTRWRGGLNRASPLPRTVLLGVLEFVLWLVAAWFAAVVYFQEKWGALLALGVAMALILAVARRLGAPHKSWLFTLAIAAFFPGVWVVVQPLWYWMVLLWERFAA